MALRQLLITSVHPQSVPLQLGHSEKGASGFAVTEILNRPDDFEQSLNAVRSLFRVDTTLGLVRREKRIRAVFMDMDSTVIEQESIVEMSRTIGKADEVSRITEDAMAGRIDFKEALSRRLGMLAGTPATVFDEVRRGLTLTPQMGEFAARCRKANIAMYLVSGGFNELAGPLARDLGFTGFHANELEKRNGLLTGQVVGAVVDRASKGQFVASTMKSKGWGRDEVVVVGDGANDLDMMALTDFAVGFRPKAALYPHIHVCIGTGGHLTTADLF